LRAKPSAEAYEILGWALVVLDRVEEAEPPLAEAARLAPANADYARNLQAARAALTSPK
jgi:hypothetical protein